MVPIEVVVQPVASRLHSSRRLLIIDSAGLTYTKRFRTQRMPFGAVRVVRTGARADGRLVQVRVETSDGSVPVWTFRRHDWAVVKDAIERVSPSLPIDPPPSTPRRLAADAALRTGADPTESLRSVRRATVGRWWVQVRPWTPGFRAEAHSLAGPPAVWAGELRATLSEATDDAIAMIDEFRREE